MNAPATSQCPMALRIRGETIRCTKPAQHADGWCRGPCADPFEIGMCEAEWMTTNPNAFDTTQPVVEVDVIPDPLTDEAARESDRAAWERAVRDEARRLARDRTFCLAVVVWAHHAMTAARTHAADASMAGFAAGRWGASVARVEAWDGAADWLLSIGLQARGEAARLARERLALFRDGLLWSDELCNARTPSGAIGLVYEPPGAAARRARKAKGARLRALRNIERDQHATWIRWVRACGGAS